MKTIEKYKSYLERTLPSAIGKKAGGFAKKKKLEKVQKLILACEELSPFYSLAGFKKFEIINHAALSFATIGYEAGVSAMLDHQANLSWIIKGYAIGGAYDVVQEIIDFHSEDLKFKKEILNAAINGFAVSENFSYEKKQAFVSKLIAQGAHPYFAILGYIDCKEYIGVSDLINRYFDDLQSTDENIVFYILDRLRHSDFFDGSIINQFLSAIFNKKFLQFFIKYCSCYLPEKYQKDLKKITTLIMEEDCPWKTIEKILERSQQYDLSHQQALAYTNPKIQTWLLQGSQLVVKGVLAADLLFRIACYIVPLEQEEMKKVHSLLWTHRQCKLSFFQSTKQKAGSSVIAQHNKKPFTLVR